MERKYMLKLNPLAREDAVVTGAQYRFTILTESLIRLEYQQGGNFVDQSTQRVICRKFPQVDYRVIETEDSLEIVTARLHLYYDKKTFSHQGLRIELKESFHVYGSVWNYGDKTEDLKGTARTLDGADGETELESGILSRCGFTVLDDSNSAYLDEEQWPVAKDNESVDLYFFGYGHRYLECLKDFYHLTGSTPLLPRFALGNWWSRYYKYTEESYLALMRKFQEKGIPFSVAVIDMDWHLVDIPAEYGSGWTGYTWNTEYFPDPERFMDKLHEMGMKVTLNIHPADGVRAHESAYLSMAEELGVDSAHEDKIPFDAGSKKFMKAYFKYLHHPNEEMGVDFWWLDWQQGSRGGAPGIDTLWQLNHLHFLDNGRDGKKPLIFSRYAGPGSHRYPVGFSGDTIITWKSLDFQPYFTANASNIGYSWWSHDIGGHMNGYRDDELSLRWVQLGVFSPIMRLHSSQNEFSGKEPWNYNPMVEQIMINFLRLRHKLIPYLYTMNYLTHKEGLPLICPMYYYHDEDEAYNVPNEYYFGTELVACPITKPSDRQTLLAEFDAWLPKGDWFDFFSGFHYRGGRRLKLHRNLETIPVLAKAGGIVPLAKNITENDTKNPEELEIHIFNGALGSFELYEDKADSDMPVPVVTQFEFAPGETVRFSICVKGEAEGVIPPRRTYDLRFHGIYNAEQISVEGAILSEKAYDDEKKELSLLICETEDCITVLISPENSGIAEPDRKSVLYNILHKAQLPYQMKTDVYELLCEDENDVRLFGKLNSLKMPQALKDVLTEYIAASY